MNLIKGGYMATITLVFQGRKIISGTLWARIPATKGESAWAEWGKGSSITGNGQVFLKDSAKLHEFKIRGRLEKNGPEIQFTAQNHHLIRNFTLELELSKTG